MGLDMYLTKKIYILKDNREKVIPKRIKGVNSKRVSSIIEDMGYLCKANAIHKWFVDNIQDGNDDCKEYYVSKKKLKELLSCIEKVLKDNSLSKKLLPAQSGFFFGGTDYDKHYFGDLEKTKKIIEKMLKENGDYFYQSSW